MVGEMHGTWLKIKGINAVYTQVMLIRLNRIRSSKRTLGNYKQVIGKTDIDQ